MTKDELLAKMRERMAAEKHAYEGMSFEHYLNTSVQIMFEVAAEAITAQTELEKRLAALERRVKVGF